ncbi:MAG: glycosyltransferase [Thermodesulfobacteriota bacterium]
MASKRRPLFYVITVNYYSASYLKELVASLESLNFIERLIVINHSPEEDLGDLQAPFPVHIIVQPNAGYGAGLNRGLQEIKAEDALALLLNPDVALLTPQEMAGAIDYLVKNPRVGCLIPKSVAGDATPLYPCRTFYSWKSLLASRVDYFRRNPPPWYREHLYLDLSSTEPVEVDWGCGAAMLYRVAAFGRRPAFDPGFFLYFEDVDLCVRLWGRGWSVVYYPRLVFRHQVQRQSHASWRFFFQHLSSLCRFIRKYRGLPQRKCLPPVLP